MKTLCKSLLIAVIVATSTGLALAKGPVAPIVPASIAPQAVIPAASSSSAIESQMLAYGGLDHIASAIAGVVCSEIDDTTSSTVVIYDQASFAGLQSYQAFIANAKTLVSLYETLLSEEDKKKLDEELKNYFTESEKYKRMQKMLTAAPIDPFADAAALLSAIAVASNSESPGSIVIPDSAMAVAITRELTRSKPCASEALTVIYPPLFGKSSSADFFSADIESDLQTLQYIRRFVISRIMKNPPAPNSVLATMLKDVNDRYNGFMDSLLQVNPFTGTVGSASVIQGRQLANVLAGKGEVSDGTISFKKPAFILLASILSAGGTEHVHKTLWTALGSGDKITYSGGVIVNVSLWHANDKAPIYSDVLRYRVPFSKVKDPSRKDKVTNGDNLNIPQGKP